MLINGITALVDKLRSGYFFSAWQEPKAKPRPKNVAQRPRTPTNKSTVSIHCVLLSKTHVSVARSEILTQPPKAEENVPSIVLILARSILPDSHIHFYLSNSPNP